MCYNIQSMWTPVLLQNLVIIAYVRLLRIPAAAADIMLFSRLLTYTDLPSHSWGTRIAGSFLNALTVLAAVFMLTLLFVVLFLLQKRMYLARMMYIIIFTMLAGPWLYFIYQIITIYHVPVDTVSALVLIANFTVVGTVSIWQKLGQTPEEYDWSDSEEEEEDGDHTPDFNSIAREAAVISSSSSAPHKLPSSAQSALLTASSMRSSAVGSNIAKGGNRLEDIDDNTHATGKSKKKRFGEPADSELEHISKKHRWHTASPGLLQKFYLLALGGSLAWPFLEFPEWSVWCTLFSLVVYDVLAVLLPCGPLRYVMERMDHSDPLPGLVYKGRYFMLGLGDFVFYGALVGQAALADGLTTFNSLFGILMGLGLTTLVTTWARAKALPALPLSLVLGFAFYFLTPALLLPYCTAWTRLVTMHIN